MKDFCGCRTKVVKLDEQRYTNQNLCIKPLKSWILCARLKATAIMKMGNPAQSAQDML